jgi:hypothetical protein
MRGELLRQRMRIRIPDSVAAAGVLVIAGVSLLLGVTAALGGNLTALRYCLLFALAMVLVAAFGHTVRHHRQDLSAAITTVERKGVPMTEIRYSARQFAILVALTACLALFCALGAVESFVRRGNGFPGISVLLGAFGVFFASFLGAVASGRIRSGTITLSGNGIEQRGWSFESRLKWPDIAAVTPPFNGLPLILIFGYADADWQRRYTTRLWRIDRLPSAPTIEIDCRRFDVEPEALRDYLTEYIDNLPGG